MSLVNTPARLLPLCVHCGSNRVTTLSMVLADGSTVDFAACHRCEGRSWTDAEGPLPLSSVLDRSRKLP